ncbi:protein CDV3 homolog [Neocloeon triangulifer]|uniref:protein CDV3 homolog n=1 Tax=Neocloeon triangulifer TaxID=2078957 RepID=UPI00286F8556|nr:protein CDV3 homolog [Neocloeon triangulifer]
MADLDDFFAKKDKKKSKGKGGGRFSTVEQVARKLEETPGNTLSAPRTRAKKESKDGESGQQCHEEDEWREFEEEKKDYSGLRIQNMQLSEADEAGAASDSDNDAAEAARRAWQTAPAAPKDSDEEEDPEAPEPDPSPPPPSSANAPSAYVPPHLRSGAAPSSSPAPSGSSVNRGSRSRTAPDINNEAFFPTLSAASATEPTGAWGKKSRSRDDERGFEDVRNSKSHSNRHETSTGGSQRPVSMENKFSALRGAEQN